MNKKYWFSLLLFFIFQIGIQAQNSWQVFEKAIFKDVYVEEYFSYASMLDPEDTYIQSYDGKEMTIKGHYIPVMENIIIVSKYPYANCFFCGGAGLESIVEVRMKSTDIPEFFMDQKLEFKGKLRINATDWQQVTFILEDAVLISDGD